MKSFLALSGFALILSTQSVLADPVEPGTTDPHERARQLLVHPTGQTTTFEETSAAALTQTDPHELARRLLVSPPQARAASQRAEQVRSVSPVDPHETARAFILSLAQPAPLADASASPGRSRID